MGDSLFKNNNYVKPEQSIEFLLKKKNKNSIIVAQDSSHISDLNTQFDKIKNMITSNTKIFISIGGNDILYYNQNKHIDNKLYNKSSEIFKFFKKTIRHLFKDTKAKLYFMNIYYPKSDKFKKYENQIATWNHLLKQFTQKYDYNLIEIDKLFRHKKDFTNEIEPSYQGGNLLVNKIINI